MLITYLSHLLYFFIRLLSLTLRVQFQNPACRERAKLLHPLGSYIIPVWHGQVMGLVIAHEPFAPYAIMASRSKDGELAARFAKGFHLIPVRGSSSKNKSRSKGGTEALAQLMDYVRKGVSVGVTVDGPQGPIHQCKPGVIHLAQQTGAAILPTTCLYSSCWTLRSWDRLMIPKPFSRITVIYGEPYQVLPEAALEREIEKLNTLLRVNLEQIT
jgi:lysophospholipid acyltransferase (LPLAT)-like uncharacterized protein